MYSDRIKYGKYRRSRHGSQRPSVVGDYLKDRRPATPSAQKLNRRAAFGKKFVSIGFDNIVIGSGGGIGDTLLGKALNFCDKNRFSEIHLWTMKGLDTARRLYEKRVFELAGEYYGDQWSARILEQKFVRNCK